MRLLAIWIVSSLACTAVLPAQAQSPRSTAPVVTEQIAVRYLAVAESTSSGTQSRAVWQARFDQSKDTIESVLLWNNAHRRSGASLRMLQALTPFWNGAALVSAFDAALSAYPDTDRALLARTLNSASLAAFRVTDQTRTRAWARESIALFLTLHDSSGAGRAYQRLVQAALRDGDHAALRAFADTGARLCQSDPDCQGYFANMRGESARVREQYDSAAVHYARADSIYRSLSPNLRMDIAHNLGFTLLALGRSADAQPRFVNGLDRAIATGNRPYIAFFIAGLASVDAVDRKAADAARLFGLFDALLQATGRVPDPADAVEYDRYRSRARDQLGSTAFDASLHAGRTMPVDSVLAARRR